MIPQLLHALVQSRNEAADDVLVEAMRLGTESEQTVAMSALLRRRTVRGLSGVVGLYPRMPRSLQLTVLKNIKLFHSALRECGRSEDTERRLAAMRLIALGRQGKLTYVLSECMHSGAEQAAKGAVEAIVALSRWVATETRRLQRGRTADAGGPVVTEGAAERAALLDAEAGGGTSSSSADESTRTYQQIVEERPDIEAAVARAMDVHRGAHGPDLLRAGLLLADWPGSKTLAVLQTSKHGGQSLMVRRLQQPPDSEHVEAFLLGASHGGLRSHFGAAFSHIEEAPVLDALLRKTHWLRDHQLQLCMHQVTRGAWWGEAELLRDLSRRDPEDAGKIGEWIAASGVHDGVQDERLNVLREHAKPSFAGRVRLLLAAVRRPRGASVALLKAFLNDADERLVRMATREIVRRRPADFENILIQIMTVAPDSVRRVISRSVGQVGFESFWQRFDRLDRATRKAAGRAMLKILPDAAQRLGRRLSAGPVAQQLKAIQMAQELGLVDALAPVLQQLCGHQNPKVRSKAVGALGESTAPPAQVLLERVLNDSDARVRANAIEVLEQKQQQEYVPMLAQRARAGQNRERANAIKAMHRMKVGTATTALTAMLQDQRADHRISGLWTLKHIGWWKLITEVARLAKTDPDQRVRRYAIGVLRDVADMVQKRDAKVG